MAGEGAPGSGSSENPDALLWQKLADEEPELVVGLVDQSQELKNKAVFYGDNRMAELLNSKQKGIKPILKKIWQGNLFRNYYRQKFIKEAREEMLEEGTLVTDASETEQRRFNLETCRTFISDVDGVIDENAGDSRESLLAKHPELHQQIKELVSQYASGDITDIEDVRRRFFELVEGIKEEHFNGDQLSVSNIEEVAIAARERMDKLSTIAENMNEKFEHDDAVGRVMKGFDILYGRRNRERGEAHFNRVDRVVDKLSQTKLGSLISPTGIALSVGAAASAVELISKRTIGAAFTAVPGLSAMIFGAAREGRDFESDRARANYDERYSRETDPNDKRREKIKEVTYTHHKATLVIERMQELRDAIDEAEKNGEDTSDKIKDLLSIVANCKVLMDLDKSGTPVLQYSSEVNAPEENLALLKKYAQAKKFLREKGVDNIDEMLDPQRGTSAETAKLIMKTRDALQGEIDDKDKAARKAKLARVAKKAAIAFGTGLVAGVAMREVTALFNDNVQGILEKDNGDYTQQLTFCKKISRMIKGEHTPSNSGTFNYDMTAGKAVGGSADFTFSKAPDGTYSLVNNGKEIASGLDWDPTTGKLTSASIQQLGKNGIAVSRLGDLKGPDQIVGYRPGPVTTRQVGLGDAIRQKLGNFTHVKRDYWYDNDTQVFDRNELGLCYYTDPATGANGLVTNFSDSGSFHSGTRAVFSQLARDGKISLMISPTDSTQSTPIEVIGKLLPGSNQVCFCPADGTDAAQYFDANGKFIGRFAEAVQKLSQDTDGTQHIAPLATVVGNGFEGSFTETITGDPIPILESMKIPQYAFEYSLPDQKGLLPMFLPFIRRSKPMGESGMGPVIPSREGIRTGSYGYGYGESYYAGESQPGDVSDRVKEGKPLETGQEVGWYVEQQMANNRSPEYRDKVKTQFEGCDLLRDLDSRVKTIVTIPVYGNGKVEIEQIYGTLSQFARQQDVDMASFGVMLDLNWGGVDQEGKPRNEGTPEEVAANVQKIREAIAKAKRDFPELRLGVIEQTGHRGIGDVAEFMNDTVMYGINEAIRDGAVPEDNDIMIVRTDADSIALNDHFIAGYQEAQRENPKTPVFTGHSWFDIAQQQKAPGFGAAMFLERARRLAEGTLGDEVFTEGRTFGYSAKHFAAVNCFGFDGGWYGAGSDDLRVGYRISNALVGQFAQRRYNGVGGDTLFDADTRMIVKSKTSSLITDADRQLRFYQAGQDGTFPDASSALAYDAQSGGYNADPSRPFIPDDFVEDLTDPVRFNSVAEQFEREMEALFGMDSWTGAHRFETIMAWFFECERSDFDKYFTIRDKTEEDGITRENRTKKFDFTPEGKLRLRDILVKRMGDGTNPALVSSLQQIIQTGQWGKKGKIVEPLPTPAA